MVNRGEEKVRVHMNVELRTSEPAGRLEGVLPKLMYLELDA